MRIYYNFVEDKLVLYKSVDQMCIYTEDGFRWFYGFPDIKSSILIDRFYE